MGKMFAGKSLYHAEEKAAERKKREEEERKKHDEAVEAAAEVKLRCEWDEECECVPRILSTP